MGGGPCDTSPEQFFAAGRFCYDLVYSRQQLGENVDTPTTRRGFGDDSCLRVDRDHLGTSDLHLRWRRI